MFITNTTTQIPGSYIYLFTKSQQKVEEKNNRMKEKVFVKLYHIVITIFHFDFFQKIIYIFSLSGNGFLRNF